jgi:hypothetical protein
VLGDGLVFRWLDHLQHRRARGVFCNRDHLPKVLGLFAWAGATQIAHGLVTLIFALLFRSLVPLFLAVSLLERSRLSWSAWVGPGKAGGHHPPKHYGSLILLPVILLFLLLALRPAAVPLTGLQRPAS